jgi:hypothetical protein
VIEKLDFLVRFWELKARHATLGEPLHQEEQRELLSLLQLVTSDLKVPPAGPAPRVQQALPAQMIGVNGVGAIGVEIRIVTAAALVVTCAAFASPGSPVIVRATDAVSGVEYTFPCTVVWAHMGAPHTMALVVDGIPLRAPFDDEQIVTRPATVVRRVNYERLFSWPTSQPMTHAGSQ